MLTIGLNTGYDKARENAEFNAALIPILRVCVSVPDVASIQRFERQERTCALRANPDVLLD